LNSSRIRSNRSGLSQAFTLHVNCEFKKVSILPSGFTDQPGIQPSHITQALRLTYTITAILTDDSDFNVWIWRSRHLQCRRPSTEL